MSTVRVMLAAESHPAEADAFGAYHYVFSAECLDRFAEQAVGLPVTVNFDGPPVARVEGAERTAEGVTLTVDLDDDIAQRVASPMFVAEDVEWNADYTDRLIRVADLKGIGMTDD
jgi:hypothetical protein